MIHFSLNAWQRNGRAQWGKWTGKCVHWNGYKPGRNYIFDLIILFRGMEEIWQGYDVRGHLLAMMNEMLGARWNMHIWFRILRFVSLHVFEYIFHLLLCCRFEFSQLTCWASRRSDILILEWMSGKLNAMWAWMIHFHLIRNRTMPDFHFNNMRWLY